MRSRRRGRIPSPRRSEPVCVLARYSHPRISMLSSTLIYFNKNQEEVARVTFDENEVPGWCIKSKAEPSFKRKFAAQREACAVWLREFDPETGKLRSKSQRKEMSHAY